MNLIGRNVREEDLDICEKLMVQPELITFQGHYVSREWLSELMVDGLSVVIEDNDVGIIGCVFAEKLKGNGCLLWLISIDPKYKTMGYGTMLLKYFENICKSIYNIEWVILYSTTNSLYNRHFYMKHGYENENGAFWEFGKEL